MQSIKIRRSQKGRINEIRKVSEIVRSLKTKGGVTNQ